MKKVDLVVIGAGPGGYVAALRAAQLGLSVVCVDKRAQMGGTCLNVGCIPSKALLQSSEHYFRAKQEWASHGISAEKLKVDLSVMMQRKEQIIKTLSQGISGLFKKNKVTFIEGIASFVSQTKISVSSPQGNQEIEARFILLATGSEPVALPFLPFDETRVLSSSGALSLAQIPQTLIVVGAGVIGVELGSVYSRLGTQVEFVEFAPRICPTLDPSLSQGLQTLLQKQGMQFALSTKVIAAKRSETKVTLSVQSQEGAAEEKSAEHVLVCIGRKPYTQGLALEKAGLALNTKGTLPVNSSFQTAQAHIFAIGDLIDGPMLAHKASEEGIAVAELLAGLKPHLNYMAIPNVVYTHPEVASVGLTEEEAQAAGLKVKLGMFPFKASAKARCSREEEGFVKVMIEESSNRIIGLHILGAHAGEMIAQGALAIQNKVTLQGLLHTPYPHPTLSEAIKEAALNVDKRALHI